MPRARLGSAEAPGHSGCPATAEDLLRIREALGKLQAGDFSARLTWRSGPLGEVAEAFNAAAQSNGRFHGELTRLGRRVRRDGRLDERIEVPDASGALALSARTVNSIVEDLVRPSQDVARVIGAVAVGDLSERMSAGGTRPYRGEFRRLALVVDSMVVQLAQLTEEVTRVTREVGTDGTLGGQARVRGVSGTWRVLTESVNSMAGNLTAQVRDIAQVTTAVAHGDLTQKITVDGKGEVLELKNTINTMVDQLSAFADEVTRVAREVGTDGRLGGQATVRGVSGTWKDLTESVNSMAGNLTDQVRNIAQVTTAVARR